MNWDWFYQLYSMSAAFIIFGVVWKVAIIPLGLISLVFNDYIHRIYMSLITLVPNYFMSAFAALVTLGVNDGDRSWLLSIISGSFLTLWIAMGVVQADKEMRNQFDFRNEYIISIRSWAIIPTLAFFIYCLFDIKPATNIVTIKVAELLDWVQNIPILGVIVSILAFISAIFVIIVGAIAIIGMIGSMIPSGHTRSSDYAVKD